MKYTSRNPNGVNQVASSSVAITVLNTDVAVFTTGSLELDGALTSSNALITGNVVVLGTASINTLVVNQTQYTSGSNQFGDGIEDTQTLFGTVRIPTGSFTVTGSSIMSGSLNVTGGITGSLFGTSSYALTASYLEGYVDPFPYTGSAEITGSLGVTGSLIVSGSSTVVGDTNIDGNLYPIGYNWTPVSSSNLPVALLLRGVAYGDGKFVAVGNNGSLSSTQCIAYSYDGNTWETGSLPTLSRLINITYHQGLFIAVGETGGRFYYSKDGLEWFPGIGAVNNIQYGITYGQDKFVAVGLTGDRFKYSYNGKEWFSTTHNTSLNLPFISVTYGNNKFVAVADTPDTGSIAISEDGLNWTQINRPAGFNTSNVAYGNGKFVITCTTGKMLVSTDGETWIDIQTPLTGFIWKIIYAEGLFIAAGAFSTDQNKIIVSKDSITWEIIDTPSLNNWSGFAYGNGRLVAVSFTAVDAASRIIVSGNPIQNDIPSGNKYHGDTTFTSNLSILESLQVGGSLSVSSSMQVKGSGTTNATTALLVENANASGSMVVLDNGNVGIGTNTPLTTLHSEGSIRIGGTTTGVSLSILGSGGRGGTISPRADGSSIAGLSFALAGLTTGDFRFAGTVSPSSNFGQDLGNDSQVWNFVYARTFRGRNNTAEGTTNLFSGTTSNPLILGIGGTENMRFSPTNGNVLINTTTDAGFRLDVSGSGRFTNNLTVTGSLITSALTASSAVISGNVTVLGTASINTLIVNQTQLSTGSNQLGDAADDFQTLYGTVRIPTGSLTVSGSSIISGSLIVTGSISSPSFTGTDSRVVIADPSGSLQTTSQVIIDAYIDPNGATAGLLNNISNWSIYGEYTGTPLTDTFQGQRHYNIDYFFEAINDNDWIRLIRG
jgi:hypothetical protein